MLSRKFVPPEVTDGGPEDIRRLNKALVDFFNSMGNKSALNLSEVVSLMVRGDATHPIAVQGGTAGNANGYTGKFTQVGYDVANSKGFIQAGNWGTGFSDLQIGNYLFAAADGRLYGTALHNSSGAVTGTTNQYVGSGSTTSLTATAVTNVTTVTFRRVQWMRVGNVVSGSGVVTVTPTAAGFCDVKLDLPVALGGNFADAYQCSGGGSTLSGLAVGVNVVVNNKMDIFFTATASVAEDARFAFAYEVAN